MDHSTSITDIKTAVFDDPVAYLAALGIEAVVVSDTSLAEAA